MFKYYHVDKVLISFHFYDDSRGLGVYEDDIQDDEFQVCSKSRVGVDSGDHIEESIRVP